MTDVVNTSTKEGFNAYHRSYYNNKAGYKAKRKQQFAAYYQANKTRLNERKKELVELVEGSRHFCGLYY